jgi:hypothetical protein
MGNGTLEKDTKFKKTALHGKQLILSTRDKAMQYLNRTIEKVGNEQLTPPRPATFLSPWAEPDLSLTKLANTLLSDFRPLLDWERKDADEFFWSQFE